MIFHGSHLPVCSTVFPESRLTKIFHSHNFPPESPLIRSLQPSFPLPTIRILQTACKARYNGFICRLPFLFMAFSPQIGVSWSICFFYIFFFFFFGGSGHVEAYNFRLFIHMNKDMGLFFIKGPFLLRFYIDRMRKLT